MITVVSAVAITCDRFMDCTAQLVLRSMQEVVDHPAALRLAAAERGWSFDGNGDACPRHRNAPPKKAEETEKETSGS